ncbi:MAG: hypothetical protein AAFY56_00510 [Pseudomonadota bacterium]
MQSAADKRSEMQDRLFEKCLEHAAFDQWSTRALQNAANDLDIDPLEARRYFPRGSSSLLSHLDKWLDRRLKQTLLSAGNVKAGARIGLGDVVLRRLDPLASHQETFRQAIAAKLLPQHAFDTLSSLFVTTSNVAAIAELTEEERVALNNPIARFGLGALISAATLYWLQDTSPNNANTRRFVERRVARLPQSRRRFRTSMSHFPVAKYFRPHA